MSQALDFKDYYITIRKDFENQKLFTLIHGLKDTPIKWPKSSGVYAIWEKVTNDTFDLIYVGMTGKFSNKNGKLRFNNASFNSRVQRWTPYRFCEDQRDEDTRFHFRYGPKESNTDKQKRIKFNSEAYQKSVPYFNIEIHCFHINSDHPDHSPLLLESLLLTRYLKTTGSLPPANNSL
jgi:hypothetical protein